VNSVPLSETIMPGLPRRPINAVSSRATRAPEMDVSGIAAKHSRVTSSTILRTRKRRPFASWSCTKSRLQRAFVRGAIRIGGARTYRTTAGLSAVVFITGSLALEESSLHIRSKLRDELLAGE